MACTSFDDIRCAHDYHEVEVAAFSIDRFEVEIFHFEECVSAGACDPAYFESPPTTEVAYAAGLPAGGIQWHQARDYCEWAGKRLPTSAEWELAAHGGSGAELDGVNGTLLPGIDVFLTDSGQYDFWIS